MRATVGATVDTGQGRLRGVRLEVGGTPVHAFLGVPYAGPVGGPGRFAAPRPCEGWAGERVCDRFGPAAHQPAAAPLPSPIPGMGVDRTGDDCLTLNVWAPAAAGDGLPVLVWVHGGAFTVGASSQPVYDGALLAADQRVVVVSVNYRLGALGFAAVPGAPANRGLLDLVCALRWVRRHVADFGGDPARVTVFGESAGGGAVAHLLAMPAAGGLFAGAVVQSGATNYTQTAEQAAEVADRLAAAAGDALEAVPIARLLEAQQATALALLMEGTAMPFHPWVDGEVVPATPLDAVRRGSAAGVALVVGTTLDEMRLYHDERADALDEDGLRRRLARYAASRGAADPAAAATALAAAHLRRGRSPGDAWSAVQTTGEMRVPAVRLADGHAVHGGPTYAYLFDFPAAEAPGRPRLGACHGVDIPFPFGTVERDGWDRFLGADDRTRRLSAAVRASWAAFAARRDPSASSTGDWPAYDAGRRPTMVLGATCHVVDDPERAEREAWESAVG